MKAILHVGMPKTGTSSIQQTLLNSDLGKTRWFDWSGVQHGAFVAALSGDKGHRYVQMKSADQIAKNIEKFSKKFEKGVADTGADTFIVSAERLFGMPKAKLKQVKAFLDKYATSYEVIAYIREPLSYVSSAFQQNVKTGTSNVNPARHWPEYKRKLSALGQVFGEENLNLRLYDRKVLKNGDVVHDFFDQIGAKLDPSRIVQTNESLSETGCALLYAERKMGEGVQNKDRFGTKGEKKLIQRLASLEGPSFKFASDVLDSVVKANEAEVTWLEERMKTKFPAPKKGKSEVRNNKDMLAVARGAQNQVNDLIKETVHAYEAESVEDIAHYVRVILMDPLPVPDAVKEAPKKKRRKA